MRGGCAAAGEGHGATGAGGTHSNEHEGAVRGDCDAIGVFELGVGADVVVLEARYAAAGEGGGRSGGDVDTADAVVVLVLRCIGREHTLSEERAGGTGAAHHTSEGERAAVRAWGVCARRVRRCGEAGRDATGAGGHAQQRARRRR